MGLSLESGGSLLCPPGRKAPSSKGVDDEASGVVLLVDMLDVCGRIEVGGMEEQIKSKFGGVETLPRSPLVQVSVNLSI